MSTKHLLDLLSDLGKNRELDTDDQAYETALWEGGYDDGKPFGFHNIDDSILEEIEEDDDEEEESEEIE